MTVNTYNASEWINKTQFDKDTHLNSPRKISITQSLNSLLIASRNIWVCACEPQYQHMDSQSIKILKRFKT